MIDQRLRRRVVAFDLPDTETFLQKLLGGELPGDELRNVIDLITTNTTSFFREADHFDFLAQEVVPTVVAETRAGRRPRLKVWSAATSEGAEAYTAAMVLEERKRPVWPSITRSSAPTSASGCWSGPRRPSMATTS